MIIPAINAETFEEAELQFVKIVNLFESLSSESGAKSHMVHLDIADGKFTHYKSWGNPEEFKSLAARGAALATKINFEIHLMVDHPEFQARKWFEAGAKRVIVHVEAISDIEPMSDVAKEHDAELILSAAPETPVENLLAHQGDVDGFQLLAVPPGLAGQKFDSRIVGKINDLRAKLPHVSIEVDGGINPETARMCKEAGATHLVSASYIVNAEDPRVAYDELNF